MSTLSILPSHYNVDFIIEKSGVTNHFGYEPREDGQHFRYQVADYDAVQAAIDAYPVDYLTVMVPQMLGRLLFVRNQKSVAFEYQGKKLTLDEYTNNMLAKATVTLMLDVEETQMPWLFADGAELMAREDFFDMAMLAGRHVRKCFIAHMMIAREIMAAPDIHALEAIDIDGHEAWSV